MDWSKRGNINTAALVTIVQCNTLVARCSRQLIGPADWVFVTLGPLRCEAVAYSSYCNTVEWFWWDWSLSRWQTGFFQCFDAVGWVIWPVKLVPEMTYKVSSGTLSLCSLTHYIKSTPNGTDWTACRIWLSAHAVCLRYCMIDWCRMAMCGF